MGKISCYMQIGDSIYEGDVNFDERVSTNHRLEFKSKGFQITNPKGGTTSASIDNISYTGTTIYVEGTTVLVDNIQRATLSKPIWDNAPTLPSVHLNTKKVVGISYEYLMAGKVPKGDVVGSVISKDTVLKAGQTYHFGSVVATGIDFSNINTATKSASPTKTNSPATYSNNNNNTSSSTALNITAVGIGDGVLIENGANVSIGKVQAGLVSMPGNAPQGFFQQNNDADWVEIKTTDCFDLSKKGNNSFKVTVHYPEMPDDKKDAVAQLMEEYADYCTEAQITRSVSKKIIALEFKEKGANKLYELLTSIIPPTVSNSNSKI